MNNSLRKSKPSFLQLLVFIHAQFDTSAIIAMVLYGIDSPGYCPQNCHIMDPFDKMSPFFLFVVQHSISGGNWLRRCIHKIVSSRQRPDMFLMDQPLLHSVSLEFFKGFLWKQNFSPFHSVYVWPLGRQRTTFCHELSWKKKLLRQWTFVVKEFALVCFLLWYVTTFLSHHSAPEFLACDCLKEIIATICL